MAEDADVDLVEIAPNAQPPVCRLMDYGKFRYQEQKKAQEAKAKQKVIQVKEVKFRPVTDENDFQTKLRSLVRFLNDGDKAKVTLRYRGREMAHQQFGMELMDRIRTELAEVAQVEPPRLAVAVSARFGLMGITHECVSLVWSTTSCFTTFASFLALA